MFFGHPLSGRTEGQAKSHENSKDVFIENNLNSQTVESIKKESLKHNIMNQKWP